MAGDIPHGMVWSDCYGWQPANHVARPIIQDADHLVIAAQELPPEQQYETAARIVVPLGYHLVLAKPPTRNSTELCQRVSAASNLQPFPVGL